MSIPAPTSNDELRRLLGDVPYLTIFRRFFNQVRTTESSVEEQQFVYLGVK